MPASKSSAGRKVIASNRKARRDYHILDTLEAGIELRGTEVKAIRLGHISLEESFAAIENGREVFLYQAHVQPYEYGNVHNHDPVRPRRLLLHRQEILRLAGQTAQKGCTLVPLQVYLKHGRVKIEIGVCKGKHHEDKREDLKRRTADRESQRAIADHKRR